MQRKRASAKMGLLPDRNARAPAPPPIPGVRIAYIGGGMSAPEHIRAYWQARGADFVHHVPEEDREEPGTLDRVLGWADVVFCQEGGLSLVTERRVQVFCERAGKPLIPIDNDSLLGFAVALGTWCPLG